jgi:WS/DGAT/MGAT family acyltransferase
MYLVEGLAGGRVAVVTKTHEAMVGEPDGIDLAQVILDAAPQPRRTVQALWVPQREPSSVTLVRDAVLEMVQHPARAAEAIGEAARDVQHTAARAASIAGGLASSAQAMVRRPARSPLHARLGEQRRLAIARTRLDDYRTVRAAFGGTINDVVLAVVAGALRGWLVSRAQPLRPASSVRALVPVSVADPDEAAISQAAGRHPAGRARSASAARRVRPLLVDLPVGEPDPVLRLAELRYAMTSHEASGRAVRADRIAALHGFAPPTLHALGVRAATGLTRRMYSLVITNVPGPQFPLYAAGARMTEMFPVLPLDEGQAVSIGLTSYDGGVFYGVNADRDAVRDVSAVAELLEESLAELVTAARAAADRPAARRAGRRPLATRARKASRATPDDAPGRGSRLDHP